MRLALGAGESVSYPACSTILSRYFPEHKRGFANASIIAGMALGPAFGTLAGGILMGRFGWRPVFLVVGLASLLWLLPWLRWMPTDHGDSVSHPRLPAPGMLQILEKRSAWGTCDGLFCMNYLLYFLLTWPPFYLVRDRHFSLAAMARIAGLAYFLMAVSATSAGWASDRCIASGKTATLVRSRWTGGGWDLTCCLRHQRASALGSMSVVGGGVLGNQRFQHLGNYSDACAGPQASGKWTGLQNFLGNLAGVVAPAVTGLVVERTGRFFWAFIITAVIALLGSLSWMFIVGALRQVDWSTRPPRLAQIRADV